MTTSSLGWGILGAGRIAHMFASDLATGGHRIAAVGSRDGGRARAFAGEHSIPNVHEGYEALVADPEVDIIYIATPHSHHLEHALLAIEAGKHLLIEKAFTTSGDDAQTLVDAARAKGVFVMEAMWTRFLPTMVAVRERIAAGELGEIVSITADHSQVLDLSPGSRLIEPSLGGGALLDLGVYCVSLAHAFLGPVARIQASGVVDDAGVDHRGAAILEHAGGGISSLTFSMEALGSNRAVIAGTEGVIELSPSFYQWIGFSRRSNAERQTVVEAYEPQVDGRGMQFQAAEVERCIAAGLLESALLRLDESVAILRVMDEIAERMRD
ncbi:Gfo/Idh/MocA family oxidoreductase [Agrococcus sp. ARC_14]|uniref:Gfo/Idh/MocA family protein n=1 Tax=Agrococcus sp. ARC_14 TaxID=2919927 RepID=UPI001F05C4F4|nr:Gfo/Idh/MocA family oxidoreductase [Agrococcus sp. ARC_14]MCH1881452.1 Gfo/Idh/MocA family oxidoreductase [Agrococcus sp. ARC_14]